MKRFLVSCFAQPPWIARCMSSEYRRATWEYKAKQIQEDCGRWGVDIPLGNYPDSVPGKSPHLLCGKKQGNNIPRRPFRSCKTQGEQPGGLNPVSLECDVSIWLLPRDELPAVVKIVLMLITKPNVHFVNLKQLRRSIKTCWLLSKDWRVYFWLGAKESNKSHVNSKHKSLANFECHVKKKFARSELCGIFT